MEEFLRPLVRAAVCTPISWAPKPRSRQDGAECPGTRGFGPGRGRDPHLQDRWCPAGLGRQEKWSLSAGVLAGTGGLCTSGGSPSSSLTTIPPPSRHVSPPHPLPFPGPSSTPRPLSSQPPPLSEQMGARPVPPEGLWCPPGPGAASTWVPALPGSGEGQTQAEGRNLRWHIGGGGRSCPT